MALTTPSAHEFGSEGTFKNAVVSGLQEVELIPSLQPVAGRSMPEFIGTESRLVP